MSPDLPPLTEDEVERMVARIFSVWSSESEGESPFLFSPFFGLPIRVFLAALQSRSRSGSWVPMRRSTRSTVAPRPPSG